MTVGLDRLTTPPAAPGPPRRVLGRPLALVFGALALLAAAVAALFMFAPLWGLPDTYCQTAVSPPDGDGCSAITSDRWHLIVALLVLAALLLVACLMARAYGAPPPGFSRSRAAALGLALAAVVLGFAAAGYLAIGTNKDECGSVLSKLDEDGSYNPDRPAMCAPSYDEAKRDAGISGVLGLVALSGGMWLEVADTRRRSSDA